MFPKRVQCGPSKRACKTALRTYSVQVTLNTVAASLPGSGFIRRTDCGQIVEYKSALGKQSDGGKKEGVQTFAIYGGQLSTWSSTGSIERGHSSQKYP